MTNKIVLGTVIAAVLSMGIVSTGTVTVFADDDDDDRSNGGNILQRIIEAIRELREDVEKIKDKIVDLQENDRNPIFFGSAIIESFGTVGETSSEALVPIKGTITDLTASSTDSSGPVSPGAGQSFTVTLLKNNVETSLSCTISDNENRCSNNTSDGVTVTPFNTLEIRVSSSTSVAEDTIIKTSAVFNP